LRIDQRETAQPIAGVTSMIKLPYEQKLANAEFIAHARDDVPYLLDMVEMLNFANRDYLNVMRWIYENFGAHIEMVLDGNPELAESEPETWQIFCGEVQKASADTSIH
jgi:hypothetical protein